ncbi:replication-relaxation family protein [Mangrovibacillus cuniculi]|uniref:Replication-relaxation n=1 Tax=Mangrovibacillus cuniculi TaxID=2593652 RepID=A0A7S8HG48_9BACI|nr:replication-relaxation family protein [Mangrovibacillus cuniculi]QPC47090.1 hypothetical protein G8O30_08985 [Mangrovibacillus cuniculi]QPC48503.1 hypothetical protein G8O30_15975 [Mangrovibacillus cuniculi]
MTTRDQAIINDLIKLGCMSRNDVAAIHFGELKDPVRSANSVLKRLVRDGKIKRSRDFVPYVYFPIDSKIKADSTKIPHFLEIVSVYKEMVRIQKPKVFLVEPKYGDKGDYMEPDVFAIWRGTPVFIEVQRTRVTEQTIKEKLERYEAFYESELWKDEAWQPKEKPIFPSVVLLCENKYGVKSDLLHFFEARTISDVIRKPVDIKESQNIIISSSNIKVLR